MAPKRAATEIEEPETQDRPVRLKKVLEKKTSEPASQSGAGNAKGAGAEELNPILKTPVRFKTAVAEPESESEASSEKGEYDYDYEPDPDDGCFDSEGEEEESSPEGHVPPTWTCFCSEPAATFVAGPNAKRWNRGRPFAKCARLTNRCEYWVWCDDTSPSTRQQLFNESMDARANIQSDWQNHDDDDNNLEHYGEDYDDGIGEVSYDDYDEPSLTKEEEDEQIREMAADMLRKENAARSFRGYSPSAESVDAKVEELLHDPGEDELGLGEDESDYW
ncbi:hypothetical protein DFH06DRAFT_1304004 [Mycena polygramma]|nr:hypothetical protein DFH06DRAFT_1304004 [Mycena polygramma]